MVGVNASVGVAVGTPVAVADAAIVAVAEAGIAAVAVAVAIRGASSSPQAARSAAQAIASSRGTRTFVTIRGVGV